MPKDHEPREGYKGRTTGSPSGKYPSEITPREGAVGRKPSKPSTYPTDISPREGFKSRGSTGEGDRPDVPAPNTVDPIAWRETPRPDDLSAPGA
jgi:hypothetical protein